MRTAWLLCLPLVCSAFASDMPFSRGDANGDGRLHIADPVFTLRFLFTAGPIPPCLDAADFTADGRIDPADAVAELRFLFAGGPGPLPPFPGCGAAVEPALGCARSPCATDADFYERIRTEAEFFAISVPLPLREDMARGTKFLVPSRDDPGLLPTLYQNLRRHALHYDFLVAAFPDRFPGLSYDEYLDLVMRRGTRDYFAGDLVLFVEGEALTYGFSIFTDPSAPGEVLDAGEVGAVHDEIAATFGLRPLAYAPSNALDVLAARSWEDPGFPIYFPSPVFVPDYEAYNPGVNYGRVRILTLAAFYEGEEAGAFGWQDILVVDEAPADVEAVIAGMITGSRQTELGHLNVRLSRRGTPNAYLRVPRSVLGPFADQLVRLEVGEGGVTVEGADLASAEAWWDAHRPPPPRIPRVDPEHGDLEPLEAMDPSLGTRTLAGRFGSKAANLAILYGILPAAHRVPGFAIPFRYYREFLEGNFTVDASVDPPETVSYAEWLRRMLEDPPFRTDGARRARMLAAFRDLLRAGGRVDPPLVDAIHARIVEVFGDDVTKVRFRSSSNVEDALEFGGAGLYDSTSVCAADGRDGDDDGPSLCNPRTGERTIERGLKKVWASLWNFRAFEEREYFRIPHEEAAMAVLVTLAIPDERANGVAFTGDPTNPANEGYVVNVQVGDIPVVHPAPGQVSEKDVLIVRDGRVAEIQRVRRSSLVGPGQWVLEDGQLALLGARLAGMDRDFPVDPQGYPRDRILLDAEFKFTAEGRLIFKQIRPFLRDSLRGEVKHGVGHR